MRRMTHEGSSAWRVACSCTHRFAAGTLLVTKVWGAVLRDKGAAEGMEGGGAREGASSGSLWCSAEPSESEAP